MAIRLREFNGKLVALCAAFTKPKPGDIYLDDRVHHALTEKFMKDFEAEGLIKEAKDGKDTGD